MNERTQSILGGCHSAQILLYSIEFGEFAKQERLAAEGDWSAMEATILDAARRLKAGGADFVVIASNTLNSLVNSIEPKVGLPFLRIYNAVGSRVRAAGMKKVALLGTSYTMEASFYRDTIERNYGIKVVVPTKEERDYINNAIFDELVKNDVRFDTRVEFMKIIHRMIEEQKVEGVILGCTEIPLLIKQRDVSVPVFDTCRIHAESAVDYALGTRDVFYTNQVSH